MRLLENSAKEALRSRGLAVPAGIAAASAADAGLAAASLSPASGRVAIKALVAAGRRGKAGAVEVCEAAAAAAAASRILGREVAGQRVGKVYVEEAVGISAELYLSFVFGPLRPRVVVSRHGGVDIEQVARENPTAIVTFEVDPQAGLKPWHAAELWDEAGVQAHLLPKLADISVRLYNAFCSCDALMLEVNPLAVTTEGELSIVGTMMEVDDNALFRHPAWESAAQESAGPGGRPLTAGERAVAEANRRFPGGATRYIELDGDIGLLVSGGGASLYQHDLILQFGGRPANHTDFSPTPTPDKQVAVLDTIFANPRVRGLLIGCNFLQLVRCDLMIEALAISLRKNRIDPHKFPIVIRLFGPAETEARQLAAQFAGIRYLPRGASLAEACREIVQAVAALPAQETPR